MIGERLLLKVSISFNLVFLNMATQEILDLIKKNVQEIIPGAKVSLFSSRASGTAHDESDWNILILLKEKADKALKNSIHNAVFPLSLQINAYINTVIVSEDDWNTNPSYYSLHHSVTTKPTLS